MQDIGQRLCHPRGYNQDMDLEERAALTERSNTLRSELKLWEKSFATANNGRKASRDDIKKHPDIGRALEACSCWHGG